MKPGRRRKPTEIKVLEGTWRKDRANAAEPTPRRGKVSVPDWLKGEARWAFQQLAELLGDDGARVLTQQDRMALSMLCDAYRDYRVARRTVEKEGMQVPNTNGPGMIRHQLIPVYQKAWQLVMGALTEFGLTPAARSKTSARPAEPKDPLGELLNRRATR